METSFPNGAEQAQHESIPQQREEKLPKQQEKQLEDDTASPENLSPVTEIKVFGSTHVTLSPEQSPHGFVTKELNGCIATFIVTSTAEGGKEVVFTHFPQFAQERNAQELNSLVTPSMRAAENKTVFILLQQKRAQADMLKAKVSSLLGNDIKIEERYYVNDSNNPANGILTIALDNAIHYTTWDLKGSIPL